MEASQIYILISVIVLLAIAILLFFIRGGKRKKLTPLSGIAFGFIIAGIVFGDSRVVGYSLIGIGVLLAFVDMFMRLGGK